MKVKLNEKISTVRKCCLFAVLILLIWRIDVLLLGSFQFPPSKKPTPFEHEILVGTYYYTWYGGFLHWWEGYTNAPKLGRYSSWDSSTAEWHIKWAVDNGIDFFAVSWLGPGSWEENALKHGLLQAGDLNYMRFCIFYESVLRMQNPPYTTTFISDVKYLANEYFNHPRYLKIEGKPVLILYLVNELYLKLGEDAVSTIYQVRRELLDMGFDVYLVADVIGFPMPSSQYDRFLKYFNAVTWYIFNLGSDWSSLLDSVDYTANKWLNYTRSENMSFIPSVYPGFDKTHSKLNTGQPVLVRNVSRFTEFCNIARSYAKESAKVVIVATWNEWHEGTSIEPAEEYGFEYLQVIRTVLGG